jgi:hypothetical protein
MLFWSYDLSMFNTSVLEEEKNYSNYELIINSDWREDLKIDNNANKRELNIQDILNPEDLIFWFDILDNQSEISQYKISKIGLRSKVINEKNATSISYRDIPTLLFTKADKIDSELVKERRKSGNTIVNLPDGYENYFQLSTLNTTTAYSTIENYLY